MSDQVELQPDTGEVLQQEMPDDYELSTIPVCVKEVSAPVRVQQLPRKAGATFTRTVGTTRAVRLLTADHFRAAATLLCHDQKFRFAFNKASAEDDSGMALWPAGTPLVVECATEVWVKVDTAEAPVSVVTELWASGE